MFFSAGPAEFGSLAALKRRSCVYSPRLESALLFGDDYDSVRSGGNDSSFVLAVLVCNRLAPTITNISMFLTFQSQHTIGRSARVENGFKRAVRVFVWRANLIVPKKGGRSRSLPLASGNGHPNGRTKSRARTTDTTSGASARTIDHHQFPPLASTTTRNHCARAKHQTTSAALGP